MNYLISILMAGTIGWSSLLSVDDGQVTLQRAGSASSPEVMSELKEGDAIQIKEGQVTLFVSPGRLVTFKGTGILDLAVGDRWTTQGDITVQETKMAETGLAKTFSKETATATGGGYFRSAGLLTQLAYPVAIAVEGTHPTFRWHEKIVGKVVLKDGEAKKTIWENPVVGVSLDYPDGQHPLASGRNHCWEITNAKGKPVESACFRVVSKDESATLVTIRESVSRASASDRETLCRTGVAYLARESRLEAALELLKECPVSKATESIEVSLRKRLGS